MNQYKTTAFQLVAEGAVLLGAAVMVYFNGQNTKLMSIFIAALIVARFVLLYQKGDAWVFALGVAAGGGNDVMSMWRGVYYYTPETILPVPIPIWMVVFWGLAFLFLRRLMRFGPFFEDRSGHRLLDRAFIADIGIAAAYRFIVYNWASVPYLPGALYASILAARVLVFPPRDAERKLMIAVVILGPFYEYLLIEGGLYVYQNGVVLGMPVWLVVYWAFIMRVVKAVFDWMEARLSGKRYFV